MKDKQKYLIIPRWQGYTFNKRCLAIVAQLLGYNVIIGKPTDTCRGHRANIISWVDDFPDFPEDVISPLDKPFEPCYNKFNNQTKGESYELLR